MSKGMILIRGNTSVAVDAVVAFDHAQDADGAVTDS